MRLKGVCEGREWLGETEGVCEGREGLGETEGGI